ncbi:hypothetical protein GF412_01305 [Candidatus Micrarchaeota archaeon]|nr:hypothetical protein [Candidatus Micrarchaeota archaeon]MBD3417608.1 hypothetical protein [Candidatus Micrarchaeota archaeon]
MSRTAAARAMRTEAQAGEKGNRFRVVEGKRPPNGKKLSLGEAAMKLPGMNGFGVEGPRGLKQKTAGERGAGNRGKPEQGRKYKDPNWWQHERMVM